MQTMVLLILCTLLLGAPVVLIGLGSLAAFTAYVLSSLYVWLAIGFVVAVVTANKAIEANRKAAS